MKPLKDVANSYYQLNSKSFQQSPTSNKAAPGCDKGQGANNFNLLQISSNNYLYPFLDDKEKLKEAGSSNQPLSYQQKFQIYNNIFQGFAGKKKKLLNPLKNLPQFKVNDLLNKNQNWMLLPQHKNSLNEN